MPAGRPKKQAPCFFFVNMRVVFVLQEMSVRVPSSPEWTAICRRFAEKLEEEEKEKRIQRRVLQEEGRAGSGFKGVVVAVL